MTRAEKAAAFVRRLNPGDKAPPLEQVGAILRTFLTALGDRSQTMPNQRCSILPLA